MVFSDKPFMDKGAHHVKTKIRRVVNSVVVNGLYQEYLATHSNEDPHTYLTEKCHTPRELFSAIHAMTAWVYDQCPSASRCSRQRELLMVVAPDKLCILGGGDNAYSLAHGDWREVKNAWVRCALDKVSGDKDYVTLDYQHDVSLLLEQKRHNHLTEVLQTSGGANTAKLQEELTLCEQTQNGIALYAHLAMPLTSWITWTNPVPEREHNSKLSKTLLENMIKAEKSYSHPVLSAVSIIPGDIPGDNTRAVACAFSGDPAAPTQKELLKSIMQACTGEVPNQSLVPNTPGPRQSTMTQLPTRAARQRELKRLVGNAPLTRTTFAILVRSKYAKTLPYEISMLDYTTADHVYLGCIGTPRKTSRYRYVCAVTDMGVFGVQPPALPYFQEYHSDNKLHGFNRGARQYNAEVCFYRNCNYVKRHVSEQFAFENITHLVWWDTFVADVGVFLAGIFSTPAVNAPGGDMTLSYANPAYANEMHRLWPQDTDDVLARVIKRAASLFVLGRNAYEKFAANPSNVIAKRAFEDAVKTYEATAHEYEMLAAKTPRAINPNNITENTLVCLAQALGRRINIYIPETFSGRISIDEPGQSPGVAKYTYTNQNEPSAPVSRAYRYKVFNRDGAGGTMDLLLLQETPAGGVKQTFTELRFKMLPHPLQTHQSFTMQVKAHERVVKDVGTTSSCQFAAAAFALGVKTSSEVRQETMLNLTEQLFYELRDKCKAVTRHDDLIRTTYRGYFQYMSDPLSYGDDLSLTAIANAYNCNFEVWTIDPTTGQLVWDKIITDPEAQTHSVGFMPGTGGLCGHYVALGVTTRM